MSEIRIGQTYESCQPTFAVDGKEVHTRIRVAGYPNRRKVWVTTLTDDGRELRGRWLLATQLHASGTTRAGQPRSTGYRLVQEAQATTEETPTNPSRPLVEGEA